MRVPTIRRLLRWSCLLTLLGLVMCLWSLLVPKPIPIILAMSLAQGIGTVAFLLFLTVLYFDLRLSRTLPQALAKDAPEGKKS